MLPTDPTRAAVPTSLLRSVTNRYRQIAIVIFAGRHSSPLPRSATDCYRQYSHRSICWHCSTFNRHGAPHKIKLIALPPGTTHFNAYPDITLSKNHHKICIINTCSKTY